MRAGRCGRSGRCGRGAGASPGAVGVGVALRVGARRGGGERGRGVVQRARGRAAEAVAHVHALRRPQLRLGLRRDAVELVLQAARQPRRRRRQRALAVRERRQEREVVEQLLVPFAALEQRRDRVQRLLLEHLKVGERLDGGGDHRGGGALAVEVRGHGGRAVRRERGVGRAVLVAGGRVRRGGVGAGHHVGHARERGVGREVLGRVRHERALEREPRQPRLPGGGGVRGGARGPRAARGREGGNKT